jgi:hypothetical protein
VYLTRGSNRKAHLWKHSIKWFSSFHSRRVIKIQPCYKITSLEQNKSLCDASTMHGAEMYEYNLQCLAFRHHNMNDTRSRRQERHAHLHNLNFRIWCISINMSTISNQEPKKFAGCLS